jgi:signal peptidase I
MQVQVQIHSDKPSRTVDNPTGTSSMMEKETGIAQSSRISSSSSSSSCSSSSSSGSTGGTTSGPTISLDRFLRLQDVRLCRGPSDDKDDDDARLRVGRIVVPVLQTLSQRPAMFRQGVYPGVEYRILRILQTTTRTSLSTKEPEPEQDLFYYPTNAQTTPSVSATSTPSSSSSSSSSPRTGRDDIEYELKPIYPLVAQLERPWPVRVKDCDIPKLLTARQYNVLSAVGSIAAAATALLAALVISQAVFSLYVIPSRSMDPTLKVGDVLLVEKITPRLASFLFAMSGSSGSSSSSSTRTGDIVLFHPPDRLLDIVRQSGGRSITNRDLFVKRVAAQPGDSWAVTKSGAVQVTRPLSSEQQPQQQRRDLCTTEPLRLIERYIQAHDNLLVQPQQVIVLGDCASVSVDSRVWGPLSTRDIVGRPLLRLWPPSRIGPIVSAAAQQSSSLTPISTPSLFTTLEPSAMTSSATTDADWSN